MLNIAVLFSVCSLFWLSLSSQVIGNRCTLEVYIGNDDVTHRVDLNMNINGGHLVRLQSSI